MAEKKSAPKHSDLVCIHSCRVSGKRLPVGASPDDNESKEKVAQLIRMGRLVDSRTDEGKAAIKVAKAKAEEEKNRLSGNGDPSTDRSMTRAADSGVVVPPAAKK